MKATVAAPEERWDYLFEIAAAAMNEKHPEINIKIEAEVLPYDQTHNKLVTMMVAETPVDLISADVIWVGEFANLSFRVLRRDAKHENSRRQKTVDKIEL